MALIGRGELPAAIQNKDVFKLMGRALGREIPDTLGYTVKFVTGLARQNKAVEAMEIARQMEAHARRALGPENPSTQKYVKLAQDLGVSPNK